MPFLLNPQMEITKYVHMEHGNHMEITKYHKATLKSNNSERPAEISSFMQTIGIAEIMWRPHKPGQDPVEATKFYTDTCITSRDASIANILFLRNLAFLK